MRFVCCVLVLLVACGEKTTPMQPFQIPAWTSMPTEDAIVSAIVGRGGSPGERAMTERAVRDLALPALKKATTLASLRREIEWQKMGFDAQSEVQTPSAAARLVRSYVAEALADLEYRSMLLAEHRLHMLLWPSEPVPESWKGVLKLEPLISTDAIAEAASEVEKRVREIDRYGISDAGTERSKKIIRNHVHIAKTGDYAWTTGPIYDELDARSIDTLPLGVNPW